MMYRTDPICQVARPRYASLLLILSAALTISHADSRSDGLYATITTSLGTMVAQLDTNAAPKAVASFVGLAEGSKLWLNETTDRVHSEPFYDGKIFHRIIPGFMIQTGSPNGDGVGGAGYSYESEKNRAHDKAGLLSTANTGAFPPSNGSGFFITVAPATHLDGASSAHSVFGDIIEGLDVLQALGNVPTDCTSGSACFVSVDCNDRPCDPPVIHSITIERCGAAALAFDVHAQGLPDVFSQAPTLDLSAVKTITFPLVDNTGYYLQASSNLTDWATAFLGFYSNTPPEQVFDLQQFIPPDSPYGFFSLAAVTYPAVFTPRVMEQFSFNATDGFFSFQLDDADSGSVLSGTEPRLVGNMTSWSWTQDPYQGTLLFFYEGDVTPRAVQIRMLFTDRSYSAGVFELGSGGYFSLGTVSGNFTFSFTP